MAMLSNVSLSLIGMLILTVSGYLISSFFDLEMAYYMPYILWLLGLCVFNMFLDKSHINIYAKKTDSVDEKTKSPIIKEAERANAETAERANAERAKAERAETEIATAEIAKTTATAVKPKRILKY
jgi:hypothetical protein